MRRLLTYLYSSLNGAAMKTRWMSASILFPLLIGLALSSCGPIRSLLDGAQPEGTSSDPAQSFPNAVPEGFIQDALGQMQLELPEGWIRDNRLHDGAGLQLSNEAEDLYVIVLAENKETLSRYSLEDNSGFYRKLLIDSLNLAGNSSTEITQSSTRTTSINGNSVAQYEIQGEIENAKVTYLHTTVVTTARYYQVVAWTTTDQYEKHKAALQKVVKSFREI